MGTPPPPHRPLPPRDFIWRHKRWPFSTHVLGGEFFPPCGHAAQLLLDLHRRRGRELRQVRLQASRRLPPPPVKTPKINARDARAHSKEVEDIIGSEWMPCGLASGCTIRRLVVLSGHHVIRVNNNYVPTQNKSQPTRADFAVGRLSSRNADPSPAEHDIDQCRVCVAGKNTYITHTHTHTHTPLPRPLLAPLAWRGCCPLPS